MPSAGFGGGIHAYATNDPAGQPHAFGGYGKQLKNDYRRLYGATVNFAGRGEMVPNKDTYCEIDPTVVDKWGIPVLRFHFKFSDYEYKQAKHMQETFRSIITEMGGTPMTPMPTAEQGYGIEAGGRIIHEAGVTRMGNDPSTSVLNKYCQAHDCRNVFVTDGGPFVSQADKNLTWTILALAMRTSEYIAEQRRAEAVVGRRRRPVKPAGGSGVGEKLILPWSGPPGSELRVSHDETQPTHRSFNISCRRPVAAGCVWTEAEAQQAQHQAQAAPRRRSGGPLPAEVLTRHEYATVTLLVDLIIPKDERSGSATEAGVPQFMDFMMTDQPARQTAMRGGLAWLDRECVSRFEKDLLTCTRPQRAQVLDDIGWPGKAEAGARARRRLVQRLPRPDRERLLHQQDGDRDLQVHGQPVRGRVDRLSFRGSEKMGFGGDGLSQLPTPNFQLPRDDLRTVCWKADNEPVWRPFGPLFERHFLGVGSWKLGVDTRRHSQILFAYLSISTSNPVLCRKSAGRVRSRQTR